ncbi:probable flap endonuclease 1 homolog isoform X2 [Varanus komodoensis]|uniref:probable flap endonuclease 1 homolog isoform X2 n=1 Tax=Varanus komodoensis TaxID=61221 RepID=UPI001CF781DE|nr:probable flap endonuclease 1 homolog isoform X2 [Varanus komodoensis]
MTEQQVGKVSRVPRSGPRSWQPVTLHETPVVAWKLLGAESFASPTCGSPSLLPPSEPTSPVSLPRPGQVVALDASVVICQFCSAMPKIVNRHGQDISALQGLFYRTLHLLENGIKPVFVFDGKPPDLKQAVLAKRALASGVRKGAADPAAGDRKQQLLRHDLETLLRYLGVPSVQAPAEAEATCAALVKSGHAWCTATEDLDALPFGSLRLLRHLNTKSGDLEEIALPEVLQKLRLTQEQFVDLCILLGCDYCGKIHGVGPKKALKLMQQHGSIERILQLTSRQAYPLPDRWALQETRQLFLQPEVADPGQVELRWPEPDEEGLVRFLSHEKCMKESRVRDRMKKWRETCLKRRPAPAEGPGPVAKRRPGPQGLKGFLRVTKRPKKVPSDRTPSKKQRGPGSSRKQQWEPERSPVRPAALGLPPGPLGPPTCQERNLPE